MTGGTVMMAMARARKRIVRDFVAARATSADRAIPYAPADRGAADHDMFVRLTRFGAIVEVAPGLYWLDAGRLARFRRAMRRRALAFLAAFGAVAAAAITFAE